MTTIAIQKIYIILSKPDKTDFIRLSRFLQSAFYHVNMTSSLYLITENLSESMPQIREIHKEIGRFLSEHLFARLYVHYVHPVNSLDIEDVKSCYQHIKQAAVKFDQEGYMHQEMPRLMLLPVIAPNNKSGNKPDNKPDNKIEPSSLKPLLEELKNSFLLSSLYLNRAASDLAQNKEIQRVTEKFYFSPDDSRKMPDILCNLFYHDILDDSLGKLSSDSLDMSGQCPASIIVSIQKGMIYKCIDAFRKKISFANIDEINDRDDFTSIYNESGESKIDCLKCRERVADSFANLPMPQDIREETGALLCHFGTLRQDNEDYSQAVEKYKKSLKLSPVEEAGHIYFRLAVCYTMTGLYDQALKAFSSCELIYNKQYYFHFYKGLCYFGKGDYNGAIEEFSDALRLKPNKEDMIRILIYKGTCFNNIGNYEQAVVALEKAGEKAGRVKEIYNTLGFSYFQLKNYDKSIENLTTAVEIDPYSALDYASLGSNYREKGAFDMAIVMYEKALTLDPDMILARENLERLKKKT